MGCGSSQAAAAPVALKKGPSEVKAKYKIAVIGFVAPDTRFNMDKDKNGVRYDSTPIANGIIRAGAKADILNYDPERHDEFATAAFDYDGFLVRIAPGQLSSPGVEPGAQKKFDSLMETLQTKGKAVWSSPIVTKRMGAKDALVKIKNLKVGLHDTFAYYSKKEFDAGFKKSCAFSPRVIKQNRGTAGEGIWLVWLESKRYCENFGDKALTDRDRLKLMEMSDNHVEYHTVEEFLAFCHEGPGGKAGDLWSSSYPGKYFEGGKAAGAMLVDQRLLPRIVEGEVRMQMVKDELFAIIHKKPNEGHMSAVNGLAEYTWHAPNDPQFKDLKDVFLAELPNITLQLEVAGEPLPLLWTCDFIPVDGHDSPYVIGEFNCACVGITKFGAAAGPDVDLKAVGAADLAEGYKLANLMGKKAVETLDNIKKSGGFTSVGQNTGKNAAGRLSGFKAPTPMPGDIGRESTPLRRA